MRSALFIFLLTVTPRASLALTPQQWHPETEAVIPAEWQAALDTRVAQIMNQQTFAVRMNDFASLVSDSLSTTGLSQDEHQGLVQQVRAAVLMQLKEEKARLENDQRVEERSAKRDVLVQLMHTLNELDLSSAQSIVKGKKVLGGALSSGNIFAQNALLKDMLPACNASIMSGPCSSAPEKALTSGAIILSCIAAVGIVIAWKAAQDGAKGVPAGSVVISAEEYKNLRNLQKRLGAAFSKSIYFLRDAENKGIEAFIEKANVGDEIKSCVSAGWCRLEDFAPNDALYRFVVSSAPAA